MLKRALELKGYRVLEARNGREAVDLARTLSPNFLIVDLNMPELDGLETIKSVRKLNSLADPVPIVAITAFDVYGMEQAAIEAGCSHASAFGNIGHGNRVVSPFRQQGGCSLENCRLVAGAAAAGPRFRCHVTLIGISSD